MIGFSQRGVRRGEMIDYDTPFLKLHVLAFAK
jgi:hypothetical protein